MSRETLFWAVKMEYGSFDLIGVTKLDRAYYYGKTMTGARTHGRKDTLIARFPNQAQAAAAIAKIRKAVDSVRLNFERAEEMRKLAIQVRDIAIQNAVKDAGGSTSFGDV